MGDIPNIEDVYAEHDEENRGFLYIEPYGVLTTADEIRAVFGLSDAEMPTDMLLQKPYLREVADNLLSVDGDMEFLWLERQDDSRFIRAVETYALYCVANKLCDVLPLIAARTLTDSKSTFQRFDIDIQSVVSSIRSRFAQAIQALKDAIADTKTNKVVLPALFGSGKPVYDPVTGQ